MSRPFVRRVLRSACPAALLEVRHSVMLLRRLGHPPLRAARLACSPGTAGHLDRCMAAFLPAGTVGGVVVDVGAFDGRFSESCLRALAPRRLIAFEPTRESHGLVVRRLRGFPQATALELAVGDREGDLRFGRYPLDNGNSALEMNPDVQRRYESAPPARPVHVLREERIVRQSRLDVALKDQGVSRVDVLKIDVQGAERAVLEGARETLSRTTVVLVEVLFHEHYLGAALFPELDALLRRAGFLLHGFPSQWRGPRGELLHADAIYVAGRLGVSLP